MFHSFTPLSYCQQWTPPPPQHHAAALRDGGSLVILHFYFLLFILIVSIVSGASFTKERMGWGWGGEVFFPCNPKWVGGVEGGRDGRWESGEERKTLALCPAKIKEIISVCFYDWGMMGNAERRPPRVLFILFPLNDLFSHQQSWPRKTSSPPFKPWKSRRGVHLWRRLTKQRNATLPQFHISSSIHTAGEKHIKGVVSLWPRLFARKVDTFFIWFFLS